MIIDEALSIIIKELEKKGKAYTKQYQKMRMEWEKENPGKDYWRELEKAEVKAIDMYRQDAVNVRHTISCLNEELVLFRK